MGYDTQYTTMLEGENKKIDDEIVADYMNGDEESLNILIQRHVKSVYNVARGITRSDQDAEDIAQETFVKLWKNIKRYKTGNNFKTWLLTIARNTTLDFLRKRRHMVFSDFEDENGENALLAGLADKEITAMEASIVAEDTILMQGMLEKISPLYREVLTLRYGEDLTFEEIGEILDRPMNTVKSQHRRGLIELKKVIVSDSLPHRNENI